MLNQQISGFIEYCKVSGFKAKSVESLSIRLNEFNTFIKKARLRKIKAITYRHLRRFVADYRSPSIHIKKARIRNYAVYALMYQTGLRVGEVHQLNITSVDFKNRKLLVIGKGGKRRTLHLTGELVQVLSEWLAVRQFFFKLALPYRAFYI